MFYKLIKLQVLWYDGYMHKVLAIWLHDCGEVLGVEAPCIPLLKQCFATCK